MLRMSFFELVCTIFDPGSEAPAAWVAGMADDGPPAVELGLPATSDAAGDQAVRQAAQMPRRRIRSPAPGYLCGLQKHFLSQTWDQQPFA